MRLILMLMMLLNGPGRDLLDYIPSADYWAIQGVPMTNAEMLRQLHDQGSPPNAAVLIRALEEDRFNQRDRISRQLALMGPAVVPLLRAAAAGSADTDFVDHVHKVELDIAVHGQLKPVRRLMAIRTLGELGDPAMVETLKTYLGSSDPFVADYAQGAIDAIEHRHHARPEIATADLTGAVRLFPESVSWLGQERLSGGGPVPLEMMMSLMDGALGGGGSPSEFGNRFRGRLVRHIVRLVNSTGNLRVDGFTVGLTPETRDMHGVGMMVIRSQFSAAAIREQLAGLLQPDTVQTDPTMFRFPGCSVLVPSDQEVAIIMEDGDDTVLKFVQGALSDKSRKANPELLKLAEVGSANAADHLWLVSRPGAGRGVLPMMEACDTIALRGRLSEGHLLLRLTGKGGEGTGDMCDQQLQIELRSAQSYLHTDAPDAVGAALEQVFSEVKSGHDGRGFWAEVELSELSRSLLVMPALSTLPYHYGGERVPENHWQAEQR